MSDTITVKPVDTAIKEASNVSAPNVSVPSVSAPVISTPSMSAQPIIVYEQPSASRYIYSVFHGSMSLIAIYLSFKCNKGFDFGSFLVAICCPYIYIVYTLATKGTCGLLEKAETK